MKNGNSVQHRGWPPRHRDRPRLQVAREHHHLVVGALLEDQGGLRGHHQLHAREGAAEDVDDLALPSLGQVRLDLVDERFPG